MKRRILTLISIVAAVSACTKEQASLPIAGNSSFIARSEQSKTVIDLNDGSISWEEGDTVAVWGKNSAKAPFIAQSSGKTTNLFNKDVTIDDSETYYALSPYSESSRIESGKLIFELPLEQVAVKNNFSYNPSIATTTGSLRSFNFYNVCGLLGFEISKENVSKVIITSISGGHIAGDVSINLSSVDFSEPSTIVPEVSNGSANISVVSTTVFEPGIYYVAMLPQTFPNGISITMYDSEGKLSTKHHTSSFTLERSEALLPSIIDEGVFSNKYLIASPAQLQSFLTTAPLLSESTEATLVCDLDMTGISVTPAETYSGIFDGAGYKIKNWQTTKPLFNEVAQGALIRNIQIDASCKLNVKGITEDYNRPCYIAKVNKGTVSACVNYSDIDYTESSKPLNTCFGTLVAYSEGQVLNCENHGKITVKLSGSFKSLKIRYGAIVGACKGEESSTLVKGCTNYGDFAMNLSGTSSSCNVVLGGVVGLIAKDGNPVANPSVTLGIVTECRNEGNISIVSSGSSCKLANINLGGVVGYSEGVVDNSSNIGNISASTINGALTSGRPAVGGVAGYSMHSKYCTNEGTVELKGKFASASKAAAFTGSSVDSSLGGIVGAAGATAVSDGVLVNRCVNSGPVQADIDMDSSSTVPYYVGGIVGYTNAYISICSNEETGAVTVKSKASDTTVGGIAGVTKYKIYQGENHAPVSLDLVNTTQNGNQSTACKIAGVCGLCKYYSKDNGQYNLNINTGRITLRNGVYTSDKVSYVAGIFGGNTTYNFTASKDANANINYETGVIDVDSPLCLCIAGALGSISQVTAGTNSTEDLRNYADILVKNPGEGSIVSGLVAKHQSGTVGKNLFVGRKDRYVNISLTNSAKRNVVVGGLVGTVTSSMAPTSPAAATTFTGDTLFVKIAAPDAVSGIISGTISFTNDNTTNGIGFGSGPIGIGQECSLNGSTIDITGKTFEDFDEKVFFGTITPNGNTTQTLDGQTLAGKHYYYFSKDKTTSWNDYMRGLTVL